MISRTGIFVILGACIIAGMLIAGCTQPQTTTAVQTTVIPATTEAGTAAETPAAATAGMANPASVSCGAVGGKTEIMTAADGGQYGMCTFTNGTSCEEWALFRGEGCNAGAPAAAVPSETKNAVIGMANPASVNCGTVGGKTEIMTAADGGQYGMCTFTNGTSCEEWALFRGEGCKPYTAPTAEATTAATSSSGVSATASK
jgi:putative hemolysin